MRGFMKDPHLKSNASKSSALLEKNQFDHVLDDLIKAEVEALMKDKDPACFHLTSPEIVKYQVEAEVRKTYALDDFGNYIEKAVKIFKEEGNLYLTSSEYEQLIEQLDQISKRLQTFNDFKEEKFAEALTISDEVKSFIMHLAIEKMKEMLFLDSLSIFAFLTTIDNQNPNYYYHLGLAAEKCELYELALKSYSAVSDLAPDFIESRIFKTEIYNHLSQKEEGMVELAALKEILKLSPESEKWETYVTGLDNLLKS